MSEQTLKEKLINKIREAENPSLLEEASNLFEYRSRRLFTGSMKCSEKILKKQKSKLKINKYLRVSRLIRKQTNG